MKNQKGFIGILILIVAAAAVAAGGSALYVRHQQQAKVAVTVPENEVDNSQTTPSPTPTSTTTERINMKGESEEISAKIDISTDMISTVDCGDNDCFQEKFSQCQPATLKADVGFAAIDYKIVGADAEGCKVTFKYTKNPNPEWVNKEMTCVVDNKIGFEKSIQNSFNGAITGAVVCEGPLFGALQAL